MDTPLQRTLESHCCSRVCARMSQVQHGNDCTATEAALLGVVDGRCTVLLEGRYGCRVSCDIAHYRSNRLSVIASRRTLCIWGPWHEPASRVQSSQSMDREEVTARCSAACAA